MRYEMNCIFNNGIGENLRQELAAGKLTGVHAYTAKYHEFRGIAMLEIGNLDIELNINCDVDDDSDAEIVTAFPDYFICVKYGEDRNDWESYGYADDCIGDAGHAHVDWSAENWEEQLFTDMLKTLGMYVTEANKPNAPVCSFYGKQNLKFLTANKYYI